MSKSKKRNKTNINSKIASTSTPVTNTSTKQTPLNIETRSKLETILKNQNQDDPTVLTSITVTLSLDTGRLIFDNGRHMIEHEADGPTGQYLMAALRNLKRLSQEQQDRRASRFKPEQKPKAVMEAETKIALSKYKSLGSGKGKVLIEANVSGLKGKTYKPTLDLSDLL